MGIAMFIWLRGILYERAANKCLEREREREREAYVRLRKTRYVCEWERERERERERDVMWCVGCVVQLWIITMCFDWNIEGALAFCRAIHVHKIVCAFVLDLRLLQTEWTEHGSNWNLFKKNFIWGPIFTFLARLYLYRCCCCCCCRRCCRRRYWRRHCCSYKAVVVLLLPMMLSRFIHSCRFGDRF